MQEICSSNPPVITGICDPKNLEHDTIAEELTKNKLKMNEHFELIVAIDYQQRKIRIVRAQ